MSDATRLATNSPADCGENTPLVSVITTCKGRLHHLRRTLPSMLSQSFCGGCEIVVVDYGCPRATYEWCKSLNLKRVVAARVKDDTDVFNLARARNCGAVVATGTYYAFIDADIYLHNCFLQTTVGLLAKPGVGLTKSVFVKTKPDLCGSCVVEASVYRAVRGYDEAIVGWGPEDTDFYQRCMALTECIDFRPDLFRPITHSNADRVRYYDDDSRQTSCKRISQYLEQRTGLVNPGGFGGADMDLHRGEGEKPLPVSRCIPTRIRRHARRRRNALGKALEGTASEAIPRGTVTA